MGLYRLKVILLPEALKGNPFPMDAEVAIMAHGLDVDTFREDIVKEYIEKHQFRH
jgi:hypothetical protein